MNEKGFNNVEIDQQILEIEVEVWKRVVQEIKGTTT
jgi:hypothetical protein